MADCRVKICGIRRPEDVAYANEVRPDYIGFIFVPGRRRYVSPEEAKKLRNRLDDSIRVVGVFWDEDIELIAKCVEQGVIDIVQLHGNEDAAYITALRTRLKQVPEESLKHQTNSYIVKQGMVSIWKACAIENREDVERAEESTADYILFDYKGGGSGKTIPWDLLKDVHRDYILAGGLSPENIGEAVDKLKPFAVDVSSGVESDGYKDLNKMQALMKALRT